MAQSWCWSCGCRYSGYTCPTCITLNAIKKTQSDTVRLISDMKYESFERMNEIAESSRQHLDAIQEQNDALQGQIVQMEGDIREGFAQLGGAISEITDFLRWSHHQTMWALEKQIELLTGIHDMVKNPRATQADELYRMAIDSYKRKRLADALKLLQDAIALNPGDYRVHVTMGYTYIDKRELEKARESFQSAIDYARTDSYKANALKLRARTEHLLGYTDKAIETVKEALMLAENDPEAHYALSSYMAYRLLEKE